MGGGGRHIGGLRAVHDQERSLRVGPQVFGRILRRVGRAGILGGWERSGRDRHAAVGQVLAGIRRGVHGHVQAHTGEAAPCQDQEDSEGERAPQGAAGEKDP